MIPSVTGQAVLLLFALSSTSWSQEDVIRLRNGRILVGSIEIDHKVPDGFTVTQWDTGGVLWIRWHHVSDDEKDRLLRRPRPSWASTALLDGVRLLNSSGELLGLLVRESYSEILIKTKDSRRPLRIQKQSLLRPPEMKKVTEADVYSADERVDLHAATADEKDFSAMVGLGDFAARLRLYGRAKEFYLKALAADPSRGRELQPMFRTVEELLQAPRSATEEERTSKGGAGGP
jgi:hypothetical protein